MLYGVNEFLDCNIIVGWVDKIFCLFFNVKIDFKKFKFLYFE